MLLSHILEKDTGTKIIVQRKIIIFVKKENETTDINKLS